MAVVLEESKETLQGKTSTTFTMNMPDNRPAGDLYVAIITKDDGQTVTSPTGGNWTQTIHRIDSGDNVNLSVWWKIGEDKDGGNEAATYTWGGDSEEWAGIILRFSGIDITTPLVSDSGEGVGTIPQCPAVTVPEDNCIVLRVCAVDTDQYGAGYEPANHTAYSENSSSGGGSGSVQYCVATMDTPPSKGNSTDIASFADGQISDQWCAGTVVISPPGLWADSDYGYKKRITIDHYKVAGDETDFPILISVTDGDLADTANGGHVKSSDGYDIVFYNSVEDTLLKHEIERYVNTDGLLVFWVKIPSISGTSDTYLYIYYGKSGVTVDPSSTDTWDANFKAVHHLDGANAAGCTDSTGNGNDITIEGGTPEYQQAGISSSYAVQLVRVSSEYLGMTDHASLDLVTGKCLEFWVKCGTWNNGETMMLIDKWWDGSNRAYYMNMHKDVSTGATRVGFDIEEAAVREDHPIVWETPLATGTWYHIVGDWQKDVDSGKIYIYVNANRVTTDAMTVDSRANNEDVALGCDTQLAQPRNFFDGIMGEVRISDVSRGSNWLTTTYSSISDPATFMGWGVEETAPPVLRVPKPMVAVGNPLIFQILSNLMFYRNIYIVLN